MTNTRKKLLEEITAFLDKTGMSATQFGTNVIRDGTLVGRLRDGRDITTVTADKIRYYISIHS